MPALRIPGVLTAMLAPTRLKAVRNRMLTLMQIVKKPIEQEAVDSYALPPLRDRAVKRDAKKVLAGMEKGMLVKTSERLRDFEKPALIAWAREDQLFPPKYAERLAATLPDARLEWIDDSRTFSPEDQPGKVAELIKGFVREAAAA